MKQIFILCFVLIALASPSIAQSVRPETISYGPDQRQAMDVYSPSGQDNRPIVVFVHGGGWAIGSKGSRADKDKAKHYLEQGYLFISVEYRLLPETQPTDQAKDIAMALASIQKNATNWGGDHSNMVVMGHSAGAHLVAMVHVDQDLQVQAGVKTWAGSILLDSAAYDLSAEMQNNPRRLYINAFGRDPDIWVANSPYAQLDHRPAPVVMVCSSIRNDVCDGANHFGEKLKRNGGSAKVIPLPKSHAQINKEIGKKRAYTKLIDRQITQLLR